MLHSSSDLFVDLSDVQIGRKSKLTTNCLKKMYCFFVNVHCEILNEVVTEYRKEHFDKIK